MIITKASDYAILTVSYLAAQKRGALKSKMDISRNLKLPKEFISKILQQLRDAGICESIRGKMGGYRLTKPAKKITFREVVEAMDGKFQFLECFNDDFIDCGRTKLCQPMSSEVKIMEDKIKKLMDELHFGKIKVKV